GSRYGRLSEQSATASGAEGRDSGKYGSGQRAGNSDGQDTGRRSTAFSGSAGRRRWYRLAGPLPHPARGGRGRYGHGLGSGGHLAAPPRGTESNPDGDGRRRIAPRAISPRSARNGGNPT